MNFTLTPKLKFAWILALSLWTLPNVVSAREPEIYTGFFSKVAVSGHDPVAYFTQNRPMKGEARFSTQYKGVEWRFAN